MAYLSHSKYGTCTNGTCVGVGINNNSGYITGCGDQAGSSESTSCNSYNTTTGILASTTQNIYGVYDMSGGAWEYVMGNMVNSNGLFYNQYAGFSYTLNEKYFNKYSYGNEHTTHGRGKLGDATKETLKKFGVLGNAWYNSYSGFIAGGNPWDCRGGNYRNAQYTSLFSFLSSNGSGQDAEQSSRAVLCINE